MKADDMKKVLVLNGNMRQSGNTAKLLLQFLAGTASKNNRAEEISATRARLEYCRGCLRCNLIKKCSISNDDWPVISEKILESDVLVFTSPVYFHHISAPLKKLLDRFRSFVEIRITENGLIHTPWQEWKKDFVIILSMGSPDVSEAQAVIDLFSYISHILGPGNRLHVITATGVAMVGQIGKTEKELKELYQKMGIPELLAERDAVRNKNLLEKSFRLGASLG
jgi:multimeric flavodoxin WrbA